MTFWITLFLCISLSVLGLRKAMADDVDDEDPGFNSNPQALLTNSVVPADFVMRQSVYKGLSDTKGLLVMEEWAAKPFPGFTRGRMIKVTLYALKNRNEALTWAKGAYSATTESNQIRAFGKPTPGSFSGQAIGENCWAYTASSNGPPRAPTNDSSTLVVVQGRDLFSVQLTVDQIEDAQTERIALFLVERLKQWPRPQ